MIFRTLLATSRRAYAIFLFIGMAGLGSQAVQAQDTELRVLILSGANNHAWQQTTPAIKAALEESGRFRVDVEDNVAGMKPQALEPYAVILSNFNTFGKDASVPVWDGAMKKAFIEHLGKGRGLVIVHAGSSMFYDWPEFQQLACGSWQAATGHGAIHVGQVVFTSEKCPITAGLAPFWIRDEFWQNTGVAPGAKALASSVPPDSSNTSSPDPTRHNNIIFTTEVGAARGFAIFLGHDATAMHN
ncbi:MAG: ThuA domain-containing protein, partial [Verrucomicrobiota bacterium]